MNLSSRNNCLLPTFIPKTYIILFETSLIHDILGKKKKKTWFVCHLQGANAPLFNSFEVSFWFGEPPKQKSILSVANNWSFPWYCCLWETTNSNLLHMFVKQQYTCLWDHPIAFEFVQLVRLKTCVSDVLTSVRYLPDWLSRTSFLLLKPFALVI